MSSLRDRHITATRREIMVAVAAVVNEGGLEALTFAASRSGRASASGRSIGTTRRAKRCWTASTRTSRGAARLRRVSRRTGDLPDFARRLFLAFDAQAPLVEAALAATAVRGQRRAQRSPTTATR